MSVQSFNYLVIMCYLASIGIALYAERDNLKSWRGVLAVVMLTCLVVTVGVVIMILIFLFAVKDAGAQAVVWEPDGEIIGQHRVLLTEVAWMGTKSNHNDEWFELYNKTSRPVYLCGDYGDPWFLYITFKDGGHKYIDIPPIVIEPYGYALFERTDDSTVSSIEADAIYTGSLPNEDVSGIYLVDGNSILQHKWEFPDDVPSWPEGSNETKSSAHYSMGEGIWTTSNATNGALDADGNYIWGTPGEENYNVLMFPQLYLPMVDG